MMGGIKMRPTVMEVDVNAFEHNIHQIQKYIEAVPVEGRRKNENDARN